MKKLWWLSLIILFSMCEKNIYEADPRLFNDAMHGNIVGKVVQVSSEALVVVSQVNAIDSVKISNDGSFVIPQLPIGNYDLKIKADNYRIYKMCNVMVQGAGNTYVGQIDLSTVPDLVSSHYPEDKEEIVYNNNFYRLTISITFTQPMDRESVEKAFSTYPPTEGIFHWGQYSEAPSQRYYTGNTTESWGYDKSATITTYSKITGFSYQVAQKDCFTDTTYTVTLATSAKDTAGNFLRFPLTYSFSTVQSSSTQNAILTSPSHGDINVALISYNGINITFPRNMDKTSTENAISVTPATDKTFIWSKDNSVTIYTGGAFYADATYKINIDSTAEDLDGVKLGEPFSFSFTTAPVSISNTSPRNGELFISPTSGIDLYFNTYVIKSSVTEAFSISPAINGTIDWYYDSKTNLRFTPSSSFSYNTKYTVTIGTGVKDIFDSNMKEPYVFSFIIRPE